MWSVSVDKNSLHPEFLRVIELTLAKLEEAGTPFKVYSGLRTYDHQNELYAKGRTAPGGIVTNARGGQSMHNYGLAVDLAPFNLKTPNPGDLWWPELKEVDGKVWYQLEAALKEAADEIDQENDDGLTYEWGGRWKFVDVPHCQVRTTLRELMTGYYPLSDNLEWLVKSHTTFLFQGDWIVRRTQFLLNQLRFDAGPVDGIKGKRTSAALQAAVGASELTKESVSALVIAYHAESKAK